MKTQYFFKVLGITIFSLLLLNNLGIAQIHYDTAGKVGIGTTNPEELLHISGGDILLDNGEMLKLKDSGGTARKILHMTSNDVVRLQNSVGDIAIRSDSGDDIYITNSGNVGIGTTSPAYKLHVDGDIYATGTIHGASGTTDTDWIESGGNVYRESGNVGIGTTNPESKLHVWGDLSAIKVSSHAYNLFYVGNTGSGDNRHSAYLDLKDHGATKIRLGTTENSYITGGNFGIGTASPRYKLEVKGETHHDGKISLEGSDEDATVAGGSTKICLNTSGGDFRIDHNNNVGDFFLSTPRSIIFSHGGSEVRFYKNGNIGIGTTSPSYKLHVNGTAYAAGAAGALSDYRHKTNIRDISFNAIEIVKELRPVTFEWKEPQDSGMEGLQLGFIAQDVEEVLPEAVITQDNEEQTKGLKYNSLIPLLTKAIQELEVQNESLKAENNSLRNEIEQIKEAIGL